MDTECLQCIFHYFESISCFLDETQINAINRLKRAMKYDELPTDGTKHVSLRRAIDAYHSSAKPPRQLRKTVAGNSIFCSGIDRSVSDDTLFTIFSQFGKIVGCKIYQRPKNFALDPDRTLHLRSRVPRTVSGVRIDPAHDNWRKHVKSYLRPFLADIPLDTLWVSEKGWIYLEFMTRDGACQALERLLDRHLDAEFVRPKSCIVEFSCAKEANLCMSYYVSGHSWRVSFAKESFIYEHKEPPRDNVKTLVYIPIYKERPPRTPHSPTISTSNLDVGGPRRNISSPKMDVSNGGQQLPLPDILTPNERSYTSGSYPSFAGSMNSFADPSLRPSHPLTSSEALRPFTARMGGGMPGNLPTVSAKLSSPLPPPPAFSPRSPPPVRPIVPMPAEEKNTPREPRSPMSPMSPTRDIKGLAAKHPNMCWDFHKVGGCRRGNLCRWSHGPLDPRLTKENKVEAKNEGSAAKMTVDPTTKKPDRAFPVNVKPRSDADKSANPDEKKRTQSSVTR